MMSIDGCLAGKASITVPGVVLIWFQPHCSELLEMLNCICPNCHSVITVLPVKRKASHIFEDPSLVLAQSWKRRRSEKGDEASLEATQKLETSIEKLALTDLDAQEPDEPPRIDESERPSSVEVESLEVPQENTPPVADNHFVLTESLLEKFKTKPSIRVLSNLAVLVEKYQEANPHIKIGNLYDLTYQVDFIRDHRVQKGSLQFLVRWQGWSQRSDTWEPERNIWDSATPGMFMHLAEYFLLKDEHKTAEYLSEYITRGILETKSPDYLLLSKLAKEELQRSGDYVLAPGTEDVTRMQRRIRTVMTERGVSSFLKGSKGKALIQFIRERIDAAEENHKWSLRVAEKEPNADIEIENLVDTDVLPVDLTYITECVISPQVLVLPPSRHCNCKDRACFNEGCCGLYRNSAGVSYRGYYASGRLERACYSVALYECNSKCGCAADCGNRVIQKGVQLPLTLFKTLSRGWGVKTRTRIIKGTFIGEYVGELLSSEEAIARQHENATYLFDLVPLKGQESENTIDAARKGNITRFFNHSCKPNMSTSYAYIENHNPAAPRLAFFAKQDILRNEELTFNYNLRPADGDRSMPTMQCRCGSPGCKKLLF